MKSSYYVPYNVIKDIPYGISKGTKKDISTLLSRGKNLEDNINNAYLGEIQLMLILTDSSNSKFYFIKRDNKISTWCQKFNISSKLTTSNLFIASILEKTARAFNITYKKDSKIRYLYRYKVKYNNKIKIFLIFEALATSIKPNTSLKGNWVTRKKLFLSKFKELTALEKQLYSTYL